MSYDYHDIIVEPQHYLSKRGVRFSSKSRDAKPYSLELCKVIVPWLGDAKYHHLTFVQMFGNALYSPIPEYASVNNLHRRKVAGKIEGIQHFTESLVEFNGLKRQLWSILQQGLRTIARRRGGFTVANVFARGTWKQTPELYLLWQFAIAPLVNQVNDTLEKMQKIGGIHYSRVTTKSTDFPPKAEVINAGKPFGPYKDIEVRLTTVFTTEVKNTKEGFIKEFLGLNRPLSAAWDLKGWSWAVDYFFNLGELIANLDGESLTNKVTFISTSVLKKGYLYGVEEARPIPDKDRYPSYYEPAIAAARRDGFNLMYYTEQGTVMMLKRSPQKVALVVDFQRTTDTPPPGYLPEFKFKPKPGTFQFANLASAIAISLRSFEWSDKNFLIKPHKR